MGRVIITVSLAKSGDQHDLDVPTDVEVGILVDRICRALEWESAQAGGSAYEAHAVPLGRTLSPDETLEEAGVWDGSLLILHRTGEYSRLHGALSDGPAGQWHPLDLGMQPEAGPADSATETGRSGGFTWKRLDGDD